MTVTFVVEFSLFFPFVRSFLILCVCVYKIFKRLSLLISQNKRKLIKFLGKVLETQGTKTRLQGFALHLFIYLQERKILLLLSVFKFALLQINFQVGQSESTKIRRPTTSTTPTYTKKKKNRERNLSEKEKKKIMIIK